MPRRRPLTAALRDDRGLARLAVVLGITGVLAVAGTGAALLTGTRSPLTAVGSEATRAPVNEPSLQVAGLVADKAEWKRALTLLPVDGKLTSVVVSGPGGVYEGTLAPSHWTGSTSLVPAASYTVRAELTGTDGKSTSIERTIQATSATTTLHATFTPSLGGVYGVGQPLIVRFDQPVKGAAARTTVLQHLQVTTTPEVPGAWRWYNSFEAHYRAEQYWKSGTVITAGADLSGVRLPGTDTWGTNTEVKKRMSIGLNYQSVVDITAHTMTVRLDGLVIRVLKVSTGRDIYPTKGGVHIVLTREKSHTYNSATVGIPTASPDGYYEKLPWSMRISNGGAFVHANPATTRVQGISNVSHGCVNASLVDAEWYYYHSQVGDIVDIIHAVVKPVKYDAGMADWNYTWAEWMAGTLEG